MQLIDKVAVVTAIVVSGATLGFLAFLAFLAKKVMEAKKML